MSRLRLLAIVGILFLDLPARATTYTATPPAKVVGVSDVLLATTSPTTVLTYPNKTAGNYYVDLYFRVSTGATNVTLTVNWTDAAGAQSLTVLSAASEAVGSYTVAPIFLNAAANGTISVSATAGTANQLNVSTNLTFGGQ